MLPLLILVAVASGEPVQPDRRSVAFQAELEKSQVTGDPGHPEAKSAEKWKLYRDGRGRTRNEMAEPLPTGERFAFIIDPSIPRVQLIEVSSGDVAGTRGDPPFLADKGSPSAPSGGGTPGTVASSKPLRTEDLGERTIEGLACRGERLIFDDGSMEVWTSPLLVDHPVLVRADRGGVHRVERLFNIRFGEPDPALFDVVDK
jgi:hypothetical protein